MTDRDPFQALWTSQPQEPMDLSLTDIHKRARRFQSRIRRRNYTEYAAALLVIGVFGWMAFLVPNLVVKAGATLTALGAVYVSAALHRKGGTSGRMPDGAQPLAEFHRMELVKQRDALATVWRWYLAPFIPGLLVFVAGVSFAPETGLPMSARLLQFGSAMAIVGLAFAMVGFLNARAVKTLDAEIEALDRARQSE